MKYRVLMENEVNGKTFNFAMHYTAEGIIGATNLAVEEFPEAIVREVRPVPPTLKELLEHATTALYRKAATLLN